MWSSAIMKTERNWLILARLGDGKRCHQNMAEVVFSWGLVKCGASYSEQSDDNSWEVCGGYVGLSMDFHPVAVKCIQTPIQVLD